MAFAIATVSILLLITHTPTALLQHPEIFDEKPINSAALLQPEVPDATAVSLAVNEFTIKLLAKTSELAKGTLNLALSPYTIWSLLKIIHEGSRNETAAQLEDALDIPASCEAPCQDKYRLGYKQLFNLLVQRAKDVTLNVGNGIFVEEGDQLNPNFEEIARSVYGVNVMPTDFSNRAKAAKFINQYLAKETGKHISNFVNEEDLQGTNIFLTSALYFKGLWQTPFNKSDTRNVTFFSDRRTPIAEVEMMYLKNPVPFSTLFDKKASAIELKYGDGERMSMVIVVPRWNISLHDILLLLKEVPFNRILNLLTTSADMYLDDPVKVFLPKFSIRSDLVMNAVLHGMGVTDLFNALNANLKGISSHRDLYVSRILQRAVIHVDEDGTIATAAAGADVANKSPPAEFRANRPFAYFIVDKPTQTVLFAGTVQNPKFEFQLGHGGTE